MTIILSIILFVIVIPALILLGVLFYFLDKRQVALTDLQKKTDGDVAFANRNISTVQKNIETVSKDLQQLANAAKKKKDIRRTR